MISLNTLACRRSRKRDTSYLQRKRTSLSRILTRLTGSRTLPDVATKRWQQIRSLLSSPHQFTYPTTLNAVFIDKRKALIENR